VVLKFSAGILTECLKRDDNLVILLSSVWTAILFHRPVENNDQRDDLVVAKRKLVVKNLRVRKFRLIEVAVADLVRYEAVGRGPRDWHSTMTGMIDLRTSISVPSIKPSKPSPRHRPNSSSR
jgi:hypothetical protein